MHQRAYSKNNPSKAETDDTIVGNDKPGQPGIMTYNNINTNGKNGPNMSTILVAGDVVDPVDYKQMVDFHSSSHLGAYSPVCPSGYTALGDVGRADEKCKNLNDNNKITSPCTNFNTFKCVPTDCVEKVSPGVGEYNLTGFTSMSKANFSSFNLSNNRQLKL